MNTKYAIISPRKSVLLVTDNEPQRVHPDCTVAQITQEQAEKVQEGLSSDLKVYYVFNEGALIPAAQHHAAEKTKALLIERSIRRGEKHIEKEGFTSARLVTCMDILLQAKESGTLEQRPKLAATYNWLQEVKQLALSGSTKLPPKPHSFESVLAEQSN